MYAGGMRASEVAGIQPNDLKETLSVVMVTGKGNKQRLVPIGEPAVQAVATICQRTTAKFDCDLMMVSDEGLSSCFQILAARLNELRFGKSSET